VRLEDAPPPGWYPDPDSGLELRWWDDADWTDHRRPLPTSMESAAAALSEETEAAMPPRAQFAASRDNSELVAEARAAAREEVTRAADLFSRRARTAVDRAQQVANEYLALVLRWSRFVLVAGALAVIAWFLLQLFVQAAFLDWVGDRIDNLTG